MKNYTLLQRIGEGSFGEVHEVRDNRDGTLKAAKKIRLRNVSSSAFPNEALREIRALQEIGKYHPNVVRLFDVVPHGSTVVLIMELMSSDLSDVLSSSDTPLPEDEVKSYMNMLLSGVTYVHESGIIHRDLKPSNLLISSSGVLKIADFGLARVHDPTRNDSYTHQVATRWYRAPELLFGGRHYGVGVDLWAVGAIFGELLNHSPIFPGENDINQIYRVIQVLGKPSEQEWPNVTSLPDFSKINFPDLDAVPLECVVSSSTSDSLDLLSKLLVYNPESRISARAGIGHSWFLSKPLAKEPKHLSIIGVQRSVGSGKRGLPKKLPSPENFDWNMWSTEL